MPAVRSRVVSTEGRGDRAGSWRPTGGDVRLAASAMTVAGSGFLNGRGGHRAGTAGERGHERFEVLAAVAVHGRPHLKESLGPVPVEELVGRDGEGLGRRLDLENNL